MAQALGEGVRKINYAGARHQACQLSGQRCLRQLTALPIILQSGFGSHFIDLLSPQGAANGADAKYIARKRA